jgi:protein ImuB
MFACIRTLRDPDRAVAIARAFSPRLQRYGAGCVVCDVSGLGRLLGDPPGIGAELWRACDAVDRTGAVAVAPTQMAARILAHAAAGLTVVDASEGPHLPLAPLPIRVLQQVLAVPPDGSAAPLRGSRARQAAQQDAHEQAFEVCARWGVTTLGELAALPADALAARLGQTGARLRQQAAGVDLEPLVPDPDVPRFVERMELEWPIDSLEPLAFVLARLLDPLSLALERADRGAAAIRLDLRLTDRSTHARLLQLPAAIRDARVLRTLLTLDLESHPAPAAIDVVTIEIDPAPGRVVQYSLLERARPSVEALATLTARLGALVGESRAGAAALLDSHQPDGFEMRRFAATDGWRGRPPPAAAPAGLRRFRPPVAVRVSVEHGRPVRVAIARRGLPSGHVEQCAGPWRSSGDWWAHAERQWDRDEWDVALSDGSLCRLFRARDSGVWFLDAVID